jgi:hypothetical protein
MKKEIYLCDNCGADTGEAHRQIYVSGSKPFVRFDVCNEQNCFDKLWKRAESKKRKEQTDV